MRLEKLVLLITFAAWALVGCEERKVVDVTGDIPAVPTGLYSITHNRSVELRWRANNDNDLTEGYGVYRYTRTVDDYDEYELLGKVRASNYRQDEESDVRYYTYVDDNLVNGQTYYYAVNAYNEFGESGLCQVDAVDTPRPEGYATLRDFHRYPANAGFDFSNAHIVRFDSENADIFFEYDPDLNAFFVFAADDTVDIQDYGYTGDLTDVGWGDPGGGEGWSAVGWLELVVHHSYIVWTADDHYATFRVEATDSRVNNLTVEIRWAYQPSDDEVWRKELKPCLLQRPPHAANYGRRES